jgi:hypothetical protein
MLHNVSRISVLLAVTSLWSLLGLAGAAPPD